MLREGLLWLREVPNLTRLSYTELQPGRSHGSGAEYPVVVASSGSGRPFHTAADQAFAQTQDHGLKHRLRAQIST